MNAYVSYDSLCVDFQHDLKFVVGFERSWLYEGWITPVRVLFKEQRKWENGRDLPGDDMIYRVLV